LRARDLVLEQQQAARRHRQLTPTQGPIAGPDLLDGPDRALPGRLEVLARVVEQRARAKSLGRFFVKARLLRLDDRARQVCFQAGGRARRSARFDQHLAEGDPQPNPGNLLDAMQLLQATAGHLCRLGVGEHAQAALGRDDGALRGQQRVTAEGGVVRDLARDGVVVAARRVQPAGDLQVDQAAPRR
jgi:hypothetical protein